MMISAPQLHVRTAGHVRAGSGSRSGRLRERAAHGGLIAGTALRCLVLLLGAVSWGGELVDGRALAAGALYALIPGLLKGFLNANEMVVTIMLNYVATLLTGYLASYPFKAKGVGFAATDLIEKSAELPRFSKMTQLNYSFVIALVVVLLAYVLFKKTKLGYEIDAIGKNGNFAEAVGMNVAKKTVLIMIISGMIASLAGAGEVLGVHHRFISDFSPGYGWDGLTIALLGSNHPAGVLVAALFFGMLKNGGSSMELVVGVPRSLIDVIQGLIIFFLAVDFIAKRFGLFQTILARFRNA